MRLVACALFVLVGCKAGEGDDYYTEPGNGGGLFGNTSGSLPDGGGGGDAGTTIMGRVCGLSEILNWDECDQAGLDGLLVTVGTSQKTTTANGTFTDMPSPTGSNLVWRVSGNTQMKSLLEYPGDLTIPSIKTNLYQNVAADANVAIDPTAGTIFVKVMYMGNPVAGATATLAGLNDLVRYDDAAANGSFNVDATHLDGVVWFPNVSPGATRTFTITPPQAIGTPKMTTVVVEAETATFATVAFP